MAYTIIDLTALNGDFSHGMAINNSGQVVGWTGNPRAPNNPSSPAPFVWAMGTMNNLPLPSDQWYGAALGLNDFQQVVGWSYNGVVNNAVIWTNGNYSKVPFPGDGQALYSINSGGVAAGDGGGPSNMHGHIYVFGMVLDLQPLGVLPQTPVVLPGDRYTRAYAINNSGQVAGGSDTGQPIPWPGAYASPVAGMNAVWWDTASTARPLRPLNLGEGSEAYGINDNKDIVGRSGNHAVLWPGTGGGQLISDLGPGAAFNINNFGAIIGDKFFWQNGVRIPLESLLPPGSGWSNLEGRDINDSGQITGTGTYGGHPRAFLMSQM